MATNGYHEILRQIHQLSHDDQLQLLEDLVSIVRHGDKESQLHNVMEFKGMAKNAWKDVDVKQYIEQERNSWQ